MANKKPSAAKYDTPTLDSVLKELKILNKHLEKKNSRGRQFINSLLIGFGTAIGATIIAAIVIFFLIDFFRSAESIPILNDIADIIEKSINPRW